MILAESNPPLPLRKRDKLPASVRRRWEQDCDEVVHLAKRLRAEGPELLYRGAIPESDGHATSSGLDGPRGKGAVTDRVGHLVAVDVDRRSDEEKERLEAAAEQRPAKVDDLDPVATAVADMRSMLGDAREILRKADGARARATIIPVAERPPETGEEPGCLNCERFEVFSPVHKAGRCRACYEYRRRNDRDCPENLVTSRPENSGRRRYVAAG